MDDLGAGKGVQGTCLQAHQGAGLGRTELSYLPILPTPSAPSPVGRSQIFIDNNAWVIVLGGGPVSATHLEFSLHTTTINQPAWLIPK